MTIRTGINVAIIGCFAAFASGCDSPAAPTVPAFDVALAKSDNAPVNRASGGGTIETSFGRSTYAFHASVDGAGNVKGGFELHFSSTPTNVHGDVTCFVVDGNQAWFGGVVTATSNPVAIPVGRQYIWRAVDNGEGANATEPDKVTPFFGTQSAAFCVNKPVLTNSPNDWTNGNVQIK